MPNLVTEPRGGGKLRAAYIFIFRIVVAVFSIPRLFVLICHVDMYVLSRGNKGSETEYTSEDD